MASFSIAPIAVGVDGSPPSLVAADYAAELAARRQVPLRLVHATAPPSTLERRGVVQPGELTPEQMRRAVNAWLGGVHDWIRSEHPELPVIETAQIQGFPAAVLIEESRHAAVTVTGHRGIGGFAELVLGSTSAQLAAHGHGPVIVVRERLHRKLGPILACYDGSPAAAAALNFAAQEALLRDVPLIVAHVYEHDEQAAKQLLVDATDRWADGDPAPSIEMRALRSNRPAQALIDASGDAALTVVGCRGRGGFTGLLLGSVSRSLVHHARCAVAVIHQAEH